MTQKRKAAANLPFDSNSSLKETSLLSKTVMNLDPNDFYLRPPDKHSSKYVKCKIYFFNTPKYIEIEMSTEDISKDVIRHIMTLYRHSNLQKDNPLECPQSPERYELFMIDEYESEYAPDTDMGHRNPNEEIGEFSSLAFMKKKTFLKNPNAMKDIALSQKVEEDKQLEAQNMRKIEVICNTSQFPKQNFTFIMSMSDRVFSVFDLINEELNRRRDP